MKDWTVSGEKIVIIDGGYKSYQHEEKLLGGAGYTLEIFEGDRHDRKGRMRFAQNAIGLLCRLTKVDAEFLDAVPTLKAIVRYGVGFDSIDVSAASARGVKVANVTRYADNSVSDHALALMFACTRAIPLGEKMLKSQYEKPPRTSIFEFRDKTLGIVGLGSIGETLCSKASPLFKRIFASDPYVPDERFQELGVIRTDFNTLLAESHVISLHCSLTEETAKIINRNAFRQMQKRPMLINTSRGPLIDEDALLEALNRGQIHSAGLDVFCDEPPLANRDDLLAHPHLIATGHYAWYSEESMIELQRRASENLLMLLQGKIPEDCLNP